MIRRESLKEGAELQGEFRAESKDEFSVRVSGLGCVSQKINVNGESFTITQTLFENSNCRDTPLGSIVTESTFDTGNALAVAPGARELDLTIKKVTVTSLHDRWGGLFGVDVTDQCKITDLPVNGTLEVTGLDCGAFGNFPARDAVYFTAYQLGENTLTFTKLPQESRENLGTQDRPAPRNVDLKFHYIR